MAKEINPTGTEQRLRFYLELDAELIRRPNPLPLLH